MLEFVVVLVVSLIVIAKSSHLLVTETLRIGRFLRLSDAALGFIVLGVATSLPELAVSATAAAGGNPGISVGNVVGANISDALFVLGIFAVIGGVRAGARTKSHAITALTLSVLLSVFALSGLPSGFLGVLLISAFIAYSFFSIKSGRSAARRNVRRPGFREIIFFLSLLAVLVISSKLAVDYAISLANALSVSNTFIASTLVSIGTTLPELSVGISAIRKRHPGLALGEVTGSLVTNLTLVLGAAALLSPVPLNLAPFVFLFAFALISTLVLLHFLHSGRGLGRSEGMFLLLLYAAFVFFSLESQLAS